MLLSPYLPLVCGLATTAVGAALPSLTDTVANVVEEAVGDVGDAFDDVGDAVNDLGDAAGDLLVHGAKAIVSKIPLSTFGHFNAVRLEDAIADPSLIDKALHSMLDADVDVDMVVRQMTTTPPTTTNTTNTNTTLEEEAAEVPVSCNVSAQSTRVEWYSYPPEDRHAFLDSINCLLAAPSAGGAFSPSTSRYEDFVRTHQLFTAAVHNNGLFLLWHRYFLQAFEAALRGQCGLGDRPLPWWDETRDSGAFNTSEVFTPEFFGSLPAAVGDAGVCVTDGKFANLTCNIGPGADNIPHCLSRAGNETLTEQASAEFVAYCAQRTEFGQFSGCAETGPHGWAHNGIGSVMAEVAASPGDPVFFLHHLFVDQQFASWQEVDATRKTLVDGACQDGASPCTAALTLDSVVDVNGLLPNVTVGELMDTRGGALCYTYDRL